MLSYFFWLLVWMVLVFDVFSWFLEIFLGIRFLRGNLGVFFGWFWDLCGMDLCRFWTIGIAWEI